MILAQVFDLNSRNRLHTIIEVKSSRFELQNRTHFILDAFKNLSESSCSVVCPWEEVLRVSPGLTNFHEINYDYRVIRSVRKNSLVTVKRLRTSKRMFFLETFNEELVARDFDKHYSPYERSFNLHQAI